MGFLLFGTFIDAPTHDALRVRTNTLAVINGSRIQGLVEIASSTHQEEAIRKSVEQQYQNYDLYIMKEYEFPDNHAPQYRQIGTATDYTLFNWLFNVTFPNEAKCRDLVYAKDLYTKLIQRLLRSGTTCVQFFATNDLAPTKLLVDLCAQYGLKAFVGLVAADANSPDYYIQTTSQALEETEDFINFTHAHAAGQDKLGKDDALVYPVITPRFIPTSTLELLQGLGELRKKYQCRVQSHAAETVDQVLKVRQLFPEIGGGRDCAIFEKYGLLGSGCLLAHATHLRDYEVRDLVRTGASIAPCPIANILHSRAVAPVPRYYQLGLTKIGLGTDIAGGYSTSMLGPLRMAVVDDRTDSYVVVDRDDKPLAEYQDPDPKTNWPVGHVWAYHLATRGGAKALEIDNHSGTLDVGKHFDALLINVNAQDQAFEYWEDETKEIMFERFVNTGDDRNVRKVWVNGRMVVDKY